MQLPLFIGIDGGGTRCRARLCDASGRRLGEGYGGRANLLLGSAVVMDSILEAARAAAFASGIAAPALTGVHAGFALAGTELAGACDDLLAEPHPFASVVIESDAYGALLGAHAGRDGAILILGTGSAGLALVGGRRFRVSGYGARVSDEASGFWIGREAIRRSLWAHDGRAAMTPLAKAILAEFDSSPDAIVAFGEKAEPADFAARTPLVLDHADQRDPLALSIVTEAVSDAVTMIERLFACGAPAVSLVGGLAGPLSAWLPPPVRDRLAAAQGDALDGALLMARRAADNPARASA